MDMTLRDGISAVAGLALEPGPFSLGGLMGLPGASKPAPHKIAS